MRLTSRGSTTSTTAKSTESAVSMTTDTLPTIEAEMTTDDVTLPTMEAEMTTENGNNPRRINNLRAMEVKIMPTVVGVISWGFVPCGTRGAPTIYSNVSNYMEFITKYLKS